MLDYNYNAHWLLNTENLQSTLTRRRFFLLVYNIMSLLVVPKMYALVRDTKHARHWRHKSCMKTELSLIENIPSISTRSWFRVFSCSLTPVKAFPPRLRPTASISSINKMHGEFFRASWNMSRTWCNQVNIRIILSMLYLVSHFPTKATRAPPVQQEIGQAT